MTTFEYTFSMVSAGKDLEQRIARMMCVGFHGTTLPDSLKRLIERGIGSVILYGRNWESAEQLVRLCAEIKSFAGRPLLLAVDQEGGRVIRLKTPFSQTPPLQTIGATGDASKARRVGEILGTELRAAGIDMDFAPVMDVNTNPKNPVIGNRSFGDSAELVSRMGAAMIGGLQSQGVAACAKHFPGHGDTSQDSHLDLPRLLHPMERLQAVELPPFAAAARAGVAAIMTAHIVFEAIDKKFPATMSRVILHGLLRQQMGYEGVVVSDCLEMKAIADKFMLEQAAVGTVNAGADMVIVSHLLEKQNAAIDLLTQAAASGLISEERIAEANHRLNNLMKTYVRPADATKTGLSSVIGCAAHAAFLRSFTVADIGVDPTEKIAPKVS